MQELIERIRHEGTYLGNGIIKVDSFINHQLDPQLTMQMGETFAQRFAALGVTGVTKIITAEVSGIAPAFATAVTLNVPIIYARKKRPVTMMGGQHNAVFKASAPSHTKGGITDLIISPEYLKPDDRVLLIDDFLASGQTIYALTDLISQCGTTLLGIGGVIEKHYEGARALLASLNVPIVSLAIIESANEHGIIVCDDAS